MSNSIDASEIVFARVAEIVLRARARAQEEANLKIEAEGINHEYASSKKYQSEEVKKHANQVSISH